jgi:endonuclease/exonuclease/phosphatase (EEP) superfamily protein YafD
VFLSAIAILAPHINAAMLFLEILQQYKIQVTVIAVLWLLFFAVRRQYFCALAQFSLILWSIYVIASAYDAHAESGIQCKSPANLRVMTFNSYHMNSDYVAIIDSITRANPDIILFQEFKSGLYGVAKRVLQPNYPFSYAEIDHGVFQGKAIYSKHAIRFAESVELRGAFQKVIHAGVEFDGRNVHVVNIHTVSPQSDTRIALRNTEMMMLSGLITQLRKEGEAMIVGGDFNSVPWQKYVYAFKRETGLNNNGLKNIILTWPSWLPALFQVPIDHIFYSKEFKISNYHKGLSAGSDHYPIFADLTLCK